MNEPKILRGGELLVHLAPLCGVDVRLVQKIVIVADMNDVARVYVKLIGSEALLDVKFEEAEITVLK